MTILFWVPISLWEQFVLWIADECYPFAMQVKIMLINWLVCLVPFVNLFWCWSIITVNLEKMRELDAENR